MPSITVNVYIWQTATPIAGATVTVTGYPSATTNASGVAVVPGVAGNQSATITTQKAGYQTDIRSPYISEQNYSTDVYLQHMTAAICGLTQLVIIDESNQINYVVYPDNVQPICNPGNNLSFNINLVNSGDAQDYLWVRVKDLSGVVIAEMMSSGPILPGTNTGATRSSLPMPSTDYPLVMTFGHGSTYDAGEDGSITFTVKTTVTPPPNGTTDGTQKKIVFERAMAQRLYDIAIQYGRARFADFIKSRCKWRSV